MENPKKIPVLNNGHLDTALNDTLADGVAGESGDIVDFELRYETLAMCFDGLHADAEFPGDFLVGFAFGDELDHFHFAGGELNPIFAGHFPGMQIYPGVMQIESMGQAGLCMAFFLKNDTTEIANGSIPVKGLFTRVHNAGFNKSVMPGDTMIIRVKSLEDDDFMGLMSAQVLVNDEIYSHSILEVFYA